MLDLTGGAATASKTGTLSIESAPGLAASSGLTVGVRVGDRVSPAVVVAVGDEVGAPVAGTGLAVDAAAGGGLGRSTVHCRGVTGDVALPMVGGGVVSAGMVVTAEALAGVLSLEADIVTDTGVVEGKVEVAGALSSERGVLSCRAGTGAVLGCVDDVAGVSPSEMGTSSSGTGTGAAVGSVGKGVVVSSSETGTGDGFVVGFTVSRSGEVVRVVFAPNPSGQHRLSAATLMAAHAGLDLSVVRASTTRPPHVVPALSEITTSASTESPSGHTGHEAGQHTASAAFELAQTLLDSS